MLYFPLKIKGSKYLRFNYFIMFIMLYGNVLKLLRNKRLAKH